MMEILQDRHLVLERGLLLGGEPHLVNHLNGHGTARDPVDPAVDDPELAGAENLVREDLVCLADLRLPPLLLLLAGLHRAHRLLLVDGGGGRRVLLARGGAGLHHRHHRVLDGGLPGQGRLLPSWTGLATLRDRSMRPCTTDLTLTSALAESSPT